MHRMLRDVRSMKADARCRWLSDRPAPLPPIRLWNDAHFL